MHPSNAYGTNCFSVHGVHFYKYRGFYLNFEKNIPDKPKDFYTHISKHLEYSPALITFIENQPLKTSNQLIWGVVGKRETIDIASLTSKARYEIKSGEKKYFIKKLDLNDSLINEIKEIYKISFFKYGRKFSQSELKHYIDTLIFSKKHPTIIETWGCYSDKNLIGVAIMGVDESTKSFDLKNLKVNYQLSEAGLTNYFIYFLVNHYLSNCSEGFFTTGTISISHDTNFQEFLCKKLGFAIYPGIPVLIMFKPISLILNKIQYLLRIIPVPFKSKKLQLFLMVKIY
jgi:hypothetical protein